ncbi:MAG: hypothetical protein VKO44_05815 [Cyanobacteriota bacterium]|nr:hypothetical protein [Cyanobacteriota bacterium]
MPLVLPVLVLLLLGGVTLANRSMNSYLMAAKQSDAQGARQAAEGGLSRVLSALNPYGKGASDPYLSYLLGTRWEAGSGWRLASEESSAVREILRTCRISEQGLRGQRPPSPSVVSSLLRGAVGPTDSGGSVLRYEVLDYEPPEPPSQSSDNRDLPSDCADFTSVSGGTARITVRGWVERGGRQMGSFTLTRTLEVGSSPLAPLAPSWWLENLPGYPIALRIGGTGTGVEQLRSKVYVDPDPDRSDADVQEVDLSSTDPPKTLVDAIGKLRPLCESCSAAADVDELPPLPSGSAPNPDLPLYPFDTDSPPITPVSIPASGPGASPVELPYTSGGEIDASRGCVRSEDSLPSRPGEVDCWISGVAAGVTLHVNTTLRPVNLIITGDVGSSALPVVIKHRYDGKFFDHNDPEADLKIPLRLKWNRLRIFGIKPTDAESCSVSQSAYINPAFTPRTASASSPSGYSSSLAGAFVWLPRGLLDYRGAGGSPVAVPTGHQLLSSWWVCNLSLNLSEPLDFILPLYGNPESLSAILPGGFGEAGSFTADPRFSVYPTLLRIRSVY